MSQRVGSERYYALDGLRGIMMMLGVVIHAAAFYTADPTDWPVKDHSRSGLFDLLTFFIHNFRMPVFFVMAGFFAALLYDRRGLKQMIVNRVKRILIPLVVSWLILFPVIVCCISFANSTPASPASFSVKEYLRTGTYFVGQGPPHLGYIYYADWGHLWFLYYLLFFYTFGLLLAQAARKIPSNPRHRISTFIRRSIRSAWRPLIFSVITALTVYPAGGSMIRTSTSFVPAWLSLLGYGVFFGFGWALFVHKESLTTFQRHAWALTFTAVFLFLISVWTVPAVRHALPQAHAVAHLTELGLRSLIAWLLVFGLTGLFIRYLNRPFPLVRYISDASYWIYLVHPPVLICLAGILAPAPLSAILKFTLLLIISAPILFLSYHYGVRSTCVGEFLNGRRYSRLTPQRVARDNHSFVTRT